MQPARRHNIPEGIPTDTLTYRWVSVVLRIGMYASFAMMVGGLIWWLLSGSPGGDVTHSIAIPVHEIAPELLELNPLALTSLGVLSLLLTPGVTLFTAAVTFAMGRTWVFAALSLALALVITVGIGLSLGWRL